LAGTAEKYLKPEVIRQVARLDLRAKFIVEGFIAGLPREPLPGVFGRILRAPQVHVRRQYLRHRLERYAKTDRFYVKKFQGGDEPSRATWQWTFPGSMGYTYRQELTKFEYSICLGRRHCVT